MAHEMSLGQIHRIPLTLKHNCALTSYSQVRRMKYIATQVHGNHNGLTMEQYTKKSLLVSMAEMTGSVDDAVGARNLPG